MGYWRSRENVVAVLGRSAAFLLLIALSTSPARADLAEAQNYFRTGRYLECSRAAEEAIDAGEWQEQWRLLKIEADLACGQYSSARKTLEEALPRYPSSISLRLLGRRVMQLNNRPDEADKLLAEIETLINQAPWRYSDPANLVVVGQVLLLRGEDPGQVLEAFFDRARKAKPDYLGAYLAAADLALSKNDFALAAEGLENALKIANDSPDVYCKLAQAYAPSDAEKATAYLEKALAINPRHVESLLVQVENAIDAERYDDAKSLLDRVLSINLREPRAWAYLAVLAHLEADETGERLWRSAALSIWKSNPEIDHLIGRKLSQKYRFAEGAAAQRRALKLSPNYQPAKQQLSQDLLRLGEEEEGWRLAAEVFSRDEYNVLAYNLTTLYEQLQTFRTLEAIDEKGGGFIVRMNAREAEVYGDRVLALLERARTVLCEKYDVQLEKPIVVEIFDQSKDFAIRTFGLPGGAGFLGVCFGRVITVKSPAALSGHAANWEATLWHEFCHAVTLEKTRNKMPRWLSEGISVYEERQANANWGQSMNPRYRQMILDGELTPVSQLSGAFLSPPSGLHLQFAYYESALVVEYLVEKYGLETLQRILTDLSAGLTINESLQRYTRSLAAFDAEFAAYAKEKALALAPEADWSEPDLSPAADLSRWEEWSRETPNNISALRTLAKKLIEAEKFSEAKRPLTALRTLYPDDHGAENVYHLLAQVHRALGETTEERECLEAWAARDAQATLAYLRLLELTAASEDWSAVRKSAEDLMGVNPLLTIPHEYLAKAGEALDDTSTAQAAYRALLALDPYDPAEMHYRLARHLLREGKTAEAKYHVLRSLEEAPRFRAAHQLLLQVVDGEDP